MVLKSKSPLTKFVALVLLLGIILNLVACSKENSLTTFKAGEHKEFVEEIDEILSNYSITLSEIESRFPMAKEFNEADPKMKSAMALELAKIWLLQRHLD